MDTLFLNIGCGAFPFPAPWINIDVEDPRPQDPEGWGDAIFYQLDIREGLPFGDGSSSEIHLGYVLGQVESLDETLAVLAEVDRIAAPDAHIVLMDIYRMQSGIVTDYFEVRGFTSSEIRFDTKSALTDPIYPGAPGYDDQPLIGLAFSRATTKELAHA